MASSGPNSVGTLADDSSIGTITWTNTSDGVSSNNTYTWAITIGPNISETSHYLTATNFGFSIPSGATINGIIVEVEQKSSANSGTFYTVSNTIKTIKGGTIGGNNNADNTTKWNTSDSYISYGSSSDLWGQTWTDSDINSSGFGVAIAVRNVVFGKTNQYGYVDHIRITIHYTAGGGGSTSNSLLMAGD